MLFLALLFLPAGPPEATASATAPCAACVAWEATAGQVTELLARPGSLEGLDVLVRWASGEPDPSAALAELAARGARAGVIVPMGEGIPPAVRVAKRVVIDPRPWTGTDLDRLAFDIKRMATEVRAANATVEVGLETLDRWEELDKRGVGAYIDRLVGPTRLDAFARRGGGPAWLETLPLKSIESNRSAESDPFTAVVEVVGEKPLTAEEVVARHQAAAARQGDAVGRLISSGSLVVTFRVPGLAAPMTVNSEVVIYEADGVRELEQRAVRVNGVGYATDSGGVPRLPILEPDRVAVLPLDLSLDESYRYRLDGREVAEGRDCYVVVFEPAAASGAFLRGRAWIESRGFGLVRAEAAQTGLRGPIVQSEQRDEYAAVRVGEAEAWLPRRSEVRQVYEGAAHRTPIDRVLTLARHEPNPADFAARRAAAHASPAVMLSDTAEGYRYLRRARAASGDGETTRAPAGKASRVRAMAAGVLVDPGISRPLPFAGLSYVDLDFLGTGAQVDGFFGGLFGRVAWGVPSLAGSRWRAEGSAFAVLASYNDRVFAGGVERYEQDLRQRPARASIGAARPLGAQTRVRVSYELDYTRLSAADTTSAEFVVPVSPVVHGVRLGLETRRGGWTVEAWGSAARRQRWRGWGLAGSEPGGAGFQRCGASAARSFVLSPRSVARLDAAWMGGRGLDRFSRYGFDGFQNTLRGYPTATVRYDRGAVAHGVVTWNAARGLRLDGFLDAARVRDAGFGPRSRSYFGAGAAVEVPLPFGAFASVDWGYGFQARRTGGGLGAQVVKVTAYRVF